MQNLSGGTLFKCYPGPFSSVSYTEIENDKFKFTSKQYEEAKKRVETTEKAYKNLGGITGSSLTKQENQAKKEAKNQLKQQEKLAKQLLSLRRKNQQDEINLMADGTEKKLAQIDLDYQKELDAIRKQEQEWSKANGGKLTKEQSVQISLSYSQAENKRDKSISDVNKEELEAMNRYLKEYGTFQQKRDAITKEYNDKIFKATTEGDKESLKKELENKLKEVNFDELKSSINFVDIFGDLDTQSTDAITRMRDKLKEIINASAKDLKPTDLKALQDALSGIDLKMAERTPFNELKQGIDRYKDATHAVIKAQKDLNTVQQGGEIIVGSYIDSTGKIIKKLLTQTQAEKNLDKAQADRQDTLSTLTKAANSIGSQGMEVINAGNQIVDMLGNFGVAIPEAVGITLDGIGQTMSALENIDLTKPFSAITGSIGALTGIGNTVAGLFGFGGADYSGYENMKAQYETLITVWDELITKKMDYIDIDYGTEAIKAAEEAEQLVNIQINRQRQLIKQLASSGASVGSHSLGYRINDRLSKEDYQRISGLVGQKITAEYQLWDLSSEQIEKILSDEKLVSVLDTVNRDFVTYLQNIADYGDRLTEIAQKEKEAITGIGFDEFKSGYADLLSDLDSTNEDFADNFEKYLQKAIFQSLIANEYKDRIKELYDAWADYGKDGLSSDEVQALRNMQQNLTDSLLAERDRLMQGFGWESEVGSTREASRKGIATASQDSVDENNGRLAVMQGHTYSINENVNRMATGIDTIAAHTVNLSCLTNIDKTMQSILSMRDASLTHLSNIDSHTARLEAIENAIVFMKNDINTMLIKGLKLSKN